MLDLQVFEQELFLKGTMMSFKWMLQKEDWPRIEKTPPKKKKLHF